MPTLNWIGKEAVVKHHKEVPFRLLEPVPELSCPPLLLAGDGLSLPPLPPAGEERKPSKDWAAVSSSAACPPNRCSAPTARSAAT
ncbi:hypothetical protein [Methylococcus capsulatus]|uniref:hypothetical protein n=1 Tax=Methylococcus capsulatus TaxID=414 RepID=UPI00211AF7C0|nr:hypothetical protein [Methylococcus capsulatus]